MALEITGRDESKEDLARIPLTIHATTNPVLDPPKVESAHVLGCCTSVIIQRFLAVPYKELRAKDSVTGSARNASAR
jgi:hypothetical protein